LEEVTEFRKVNMLEEIMREKQKEQAVVAVTDESQLSAKEKEFNKIKKRKLEQFNTHIYRAVINEILGEPEKFSSVLQKSITKEL